MPDCIDDYVSMCVWEHRGAVRLVELFVDKLDIADLGFSGAAVTERPGYYPETVLDLHAYGAIRSYWLGSF